MTIGWAIIIVALLFLVDKYNLYKRTSKIVALAAAVILTGYIALFGFLFLQERWENRQAKLASTPASTASTPGDGWEPVPQGLNSPPDTPVVYGNEFLFRPIGSNTDTKVICYDEATGRSIGQRSPMVAGKSVCPDGSIWMEGSK
jgi:hypothetical protein